MRRASIEKIHYVSPIMAKIEVPQNNSILDALCSVLKAIVGGCPPDMVDWEAGARRFSILGLGFTLAGSDLALHICAVGWSYFISCEPFLCTSVMESISLEPPSIRRLWREEALDPYGKWIRCSFMNKLWKLTRSNQLQYESLWDCIINAYW